MEKTVIVINGAGGVGKDTLCEFAEKHFRVMNISSITPIKEIAAMCGWGGEKTDKARKFLSDLKALSIEYNDFPIYLCAVFKQKTGKTLHQVVLEEKLLLAEHWLCLTNRSVEEIAFEVGFSSRNHFCTAFKKRFGYPPSHQTYVP